MKKVFALALIALASPAVAADLPMKAAAGYTSVSTPFYNWSGFYAGLHAGYVAADASVTDTNGGVPAGPFGYKPDGAMAGVQAGYNYRIGSGLLIGAEGDLGYIGLSGGGVIPSSNPAFHQDLALSSGFYGDITARVGYIITPSLLLYGKGGYAYFDTNASQTTTKPGYVTTSAGSRNGWVAGAGAEWMFLANVSLKVEYLHYDFGSADSSQLSVGDPPIGFRYLNSTSLTLDTVKAGLNYHF